MLSFKNSFPLRTPLNDCSQFIHPSLQRSEFHLSSLKTDYWDYRSLSLPAPGSHLVRNATYSYSSDILQNSKMSGNEKAKSTESKYSLCSDLLISHFQELGIYIPGTLPFLVEQELVIAAISTNGWIRENRKRNG